MSLRGINKCRAAFIPLRHLHRIPTRAAVIPTECESRRETLGEVVAWCSFKPPTLRKRPVIFLSGQLRKFLGIIRSTPLWSIFIKGPINLAALS
jgi:hypothetical protein